LICCSADEVHVWPIRLCAPEPIVQEFLGTLSADEQSRAGRFRFEHLRSRFILSRGALRRLLGHYVGCRPKDLAFRYQPKGKPAIAGSAPLQFNASHSADLGLYAFTSGCEIGVDVEHVRAISDMEEIADRFFCPAESAELLSLSAENRGQAFFRCWTRKEAYIKAVGDGLSMSLDSFQVSLLPGDPARFVHIGHEPRAAKSWMLHHVDPAPGYVGAVAYEGASRPLTLRPLVSGEELLGILQVA
jgi:4'-phosphopantetheinyl transferase